MRVAVVGAGPAGTYASDILSKSVPDVSIDLIERLPAPYGLVRYGVAPDHPRIKQIIVALHKV
ncbi:MAG: pyridine nucleotide-disulfide oxidoreductase, partial [Actinobacteria bacterium]|nr:pyridine nucleotide-disulfide oxidoreductase [Actinomycetota bacterium]